MDFSFVGQAIHLQGFCFLRLQADIYTVYLYSINLDRPHPRKTNMNTLPVTASAVPAALSSLPSGLSGAVWRAGQMASASSPVTSSGHAALDAELPNHGWPRRGLIELLLPQSGIGELRLLRPALQALAGQRIALLQPPYQPQIATWCEWGLPPEQLLWIRTQRHADLLWSAEQILRNGSCGALLLWQGALRTEALRRLQLAAQASDMLCWLLRPLSFADDPSPAPLRLALRPLPGGVQLDVLKRRGPQCAAPIRLRWPQRRGDLFARLFPQDSSRPSPVEASDALLDRRLPATAASAVAASALV